MRTAVRIIASVIIVAVPFVWGVHVFLSDRTTEKGPDESVSEHEAGFDHDEPEIGPKELLLHPRLRGLDDWQRPEGPWHVALQVGHWKTDEAPEELKNLRVNTGTSHGQVTEWETSLSVAEETEKILEASGITVDILPVTIPPDYWADVFVSIHSDGNPDASVSGYKVAAPRRDHTEKAENFADILTEEYGQATGMNEDPNVTRSMRGYYAFNWYRYEHSIHPMTVAAIIELGFLTNPRDRNMIVRDPGKPANGIALGILKFLETERLARSDH